MSVIFEGNLRISNGYLNFLKNVLDSYKKKSFSKTIFFIYQLDALSWSGK